MEIAKILLQSLADVNAQTAPESLACQATNWKGRALLWCGGETPLFCTTARDHFDVVLCLLEHRADAHITDAQNRTCESVAAGKCRAMLDVLRTSCLVS
eukprot:Skav204966  [mRNA]  locus=scaffold6694:5757:6053:- [translate_table: standard]